MKEKIKKIAKTIKNVIFIILGVFFVLGAIVTITEEIETTILFGIIGLLFIFGGRGLFSKIPLKKTTNIKKNKEKNTETINREDSISNIEKNIKAVLGKNKANIRKRIYIYISEIIEDNEEIIAFASGTYENKSMYLLTTNKRVIIFNKGLIGSTQVEIPIEKINSIGQRKGFLLGEIHIWDSSSKIVINSVPVEQITLFVKKTNEQINNYKSFKIEVNKTVENDITDKIQKLSNLYKEGILTEYEFATKKIELLEKIKK